MRCWWNVFVVDDHYLVGYAVVNYDKYYDFEKCIIPVYMNLALGAKNWCAKVALRCCGSEIGLYTTGLCIVYVYAVP